MYQVRFIKENGAESLVHVTPSLSEVEDTLASSDLIHCVRIEVWCDGVCIRFLQLDPPRVTLPGYC